MPYKHNDARRHKFSKTKYRVTNWSDYNGSSLVKFQKILAIQGHIYFQRGLCSH